MKTIKIGQINFWLSSNDENGKWRANKLIHYLNKYSNKYKYEYSDCFNSNCDIVLYSLYNDINNLSKCKGNPMFIYWTDELSCGGYNWNELNNKCPYNYYKQDNLSISFYNDSIDNCYFPYAFWDFYTKVINSYNNRTYNIKTKFCTFCASNENMYNAKYRNSIVKYISKNYKEITCCGKVLNNTNNEYLPFDINESIKYHNDYKFNLCFENEYSKDNPMYITEKIMNAFMYNVIPIYWGCENINEIFNENAFINCNGLTELEILNKIKEIDENNDLYNDMIHEYPFKWKSINYEEFFFEKICKFIENNI